MRELTDFERHVIEEKGTERPFSGEYHLHDAQGSYVCKRCENPLYLSEHKFNAHCGWPAFDDEIQGAVKRVADADGHRVEIVCAQCDAHLGHVFEGEYLTENNIRHCVNSVSMVFKAKSEDDELNKHQFATLGGGCFWCFEAIFTQLSGVISVQSGYCGGDEASANYQAVCSGVTAHAEVVHIEFDPEVISFKDLLEVFWQSHDPTTLNQQGHDVGPQYRSVVFAHDEAQSKLANQMIEDLTQTKVWSKPIVTEISGFNTFYRAENHHHDYFEHNGEQPYCQIVIRPKVEKLRAAFGDKLKPR
ncbi:bifunctional methionine sulfoxide reductase B/A protein [Shewanella eurypsychrophilus]|uniref:Peptide methionine sulfoxide reductase MsrA n=1 Tax=Shewanella eurypsychrophilus TaxID=2593656 RepID=A0ABX6V5A6_9GAMM|nr:MULTISPECIES: bifunctional methionine sulfoxide reductase B/A protein [Shewanella]QFU22469.1 bifunctional methionine sulfoxide reductase B/A protein [Shewanella sp. YLB-09]QPG57756.1 bifunctional methionine sulfoxide reductase B/A protein [Shewanella eurypsychrophilus]